MKLQDSDIISAARHLRDEQNEQLQVAPCPVRARRSPSSLWWAATAAALVVGFMLGKAPSLLPLDAEGGASQELLSQEHDVLSGNSTASSAIVREVIHEVVHDTIYETRIVRVPVATHQMATAKAQPAETQASAGCSMLCDDIPYELLAGN